MKKLIKYTCLILTLLIFLTACSNKINLPVFSIEMPLEMEGYREEELRDCKYLVPQDWEMTSDYKIPFSASYELESGSRVFVYLSETHQNSDEWSWEEFKKAYKDEDVLLFGDSHEYKLYSFLENEKGYEGIVYTRSYNFSPEAVEETVYILNIDDFAIAHIELSIPVSNEKKYAREVLNIARTLDCSGLCEKLRSEHISISNYVESLEIKKDDTSVQMTDISQVVEMNLAAADAAHMLNLDYRIVRDGEHYFYKDNSCDEKQGMLCCNDRQKAQINNWDFFPGETEIAIYGVVKGMDKEELDSLMVEHDFSPTDYFGGEDAGHFYYSTDKDQLVIGARIENNIVKQVSIFSAVDY